MGLKFWISNKLSGEQMLLLLGMAGELEVFVYVPKKPQSAMFF